MSCLRIHPGSMPVGPTRRRGTGDGGRPFTVALTGAAERPGPGDPDGSGTARLSLNPGQEEVCFTLTVENIRLLREADSYDVNVHTSAFPAGAVRGQLG